MWAIYFDTNQLRAAGWPRVSAGLQRLLDLAEYMQIPLFVPEPVEIELEYAWIRDFTQKKASHLATHRDLSRHTANIVEVGAEPAGPTMAAARAAYREAVNAAKTSRGISSIPTTTKAIRDFVELASQRRAPFDKKGNGFRDAVILWTILDHMRANGYTGCALVTDDGDFAGPDVKAAFTTIGAEFDMHTINGLVDDLKKSLEHVKREAAAADQAAAKAALELERLNIEKAVGARLHLTEWDVKPTPLATIRRLERIELGEIKSVRTPFPFPEVEERVAVSFDAEVILHSVGETYPVQPRQMKVGEAAPLDPLGFVEAQVEPVSVTRTAEIDTTAIRTIAGEYRDFQVESARLKRGVASLAALAGLVGPLDLGAGNA